MNQSVTIIPNQMTIEKMERFYASFMVNNTGEYVHFQAIKQGLVITAYFNKKGAYKVIFYGTGALEEAKIWDENPVLTLNKKKNEIKEEWLCLDNQIGSDEVGVGDFVLPMIVVAAYVRKTDIELLRKLGVHDSKKLKDDLIMKIAPILAKNFIISRLTLDNEKYNEMYLKGENINSLKAKMHNRALLNLVKKFPETKNIFVDQFVNESTYYNYLNDKSEDKVKKITFKTKGESYYPSVALASVMARYAFLLEKEKLEKKYKMEFPCGAGSKADEFAKTFIEKFGIEELGKICKKNFVNYKDLTDIKLV